MLKVKKKPLSEKIVQNYFTQIAKFHGMTVIRLNNVRIQAGKFMKMKDADRGWPDLIVLNNRGETFYVETKSEVGKQSVFQKDRQREIEKNKGKYLLISNLLDCAEFFAINR